MLRALVMVAMLTLTTAGTAYLVRAAFPNAWQRFAKRAFVVAWAAGAASIIAWRSARALDVDVVARIAATVGGALLVSTMALFVTSLLWGPAGLIVRRAQIVDPGRRAFLGRAVGAMPLGVAATGPFGAAASMAAPIVREVEARSRAIPQGFDGVKILQFTDVHLGAFIDVEHVKQAVEAARPYAPDIVVLTGDIADDYTLLPAALSAIRSLGAPLGLFASIGNHEIYRGREQAERLFHDGGFKYLCEEGVVLERAGAKLWLCGVDDPARLGQEHRPFLARSVGNALAACPDDVMCKVVLSHRPEGFEAAAASGAALTLSGHTHGGQIALFGRSLFETFAPDSYLLGRYVKGDSLLYTSAGLGHWFPFRLNCPCEVAIVTLRSG